MRNSIVLNNKGIEKIKDSLGKLEVYSHADHSSSVLDILDGFVDTKNDTFLILSEESVEIIKISLGHLEITSPKDFTSSALEVLNNAPTVEDICGLNITAEKGL